MGRTSKDLDPTYHLVNLDSGEILWRCAEILEVRYPASYKGKPTGAGNRKSGREISRITKRLQIRTPTDRSISPLLSQRLAKHAGRCCTERNPKCGACPLVSFCPEGMKRAARYGKGKPLAVDLCSGAGALSAGFRSEGFHVVLAVENDKSAAQSYRINNPGVPVIEADVRAIRPSQALRALGLRRGDVAITIAGPPCQGYSAAGPRKPRAERNFLFRSIARIAKGLGADIIVMENVPGLRRVGGVSFENRILRCFDKAGYRGTSTVADSSAFGVPQRRRRVIFICARPNYPLDSFVLRKLKRSPPNPTVAKALRALPRPTVAGRQPRYRTRRTTVPNHRAMAHNASVIKKIRGICCGEGPLSYRRLSTQLAHTIIAGHRAMPVHPRQHRTITVREAARLQTLPDTFRFLGPHSQQPLQVANVVPYLLSRAIARSLLTWIGQSSRRIG